MAFLYGNVLSDFEVVHGLEDGESLADGMDADVFQRGVVEMDEDVARDAVLCAVRSRIRQLGPWKRVWQKGTDRAAARDSEGSRGQSTAGGRRPRRARAGP